MIAHFDGEMMALTALWTHGNAVVPETPHLLEEIAYRGFGAYVRLQRGTQQWFHVPMPTPVFIRDSRPKVRKIMILGKSDVSSCIRKVHVFDNAKRVEDHSVTICGDKLALSSGNTIWPNDLTIYFGLGISMLIDAQTFSAEFNFAGFGADWEHP
ncbi:DUF6623 family protein [Actinomadura opuntiae]|uniref:DUF6623 family protein n=1 Tax=Actinomadura sp. OS1-43 TaxID=604315 RepID=UPI00255B0FE4|nr:DUF6623 family protein [Actinomadura sp. OS1-43]MDL4814017.1 hypothetical protein [Actinomadura sp. OS1-43]